MTIDLSRATTKEKIVVALRPIKNARRGQGRAGLTSLKATLLRETIDALVITLSGLDREPHLLAERAAEKSANAMRLPFRRFH